VFCSLSGVNVGSWLNSGTAAFQRHSTTTPVASAPTFRYQSLAYYVQDFRSQAVEGSLYCLRQEVTIERQYDKWTTLVQSAAAVCTVSCGQDDGFACVRLLPSFKRCEITDAVCWHTIGQGTVAYFSDAKNQWHTN